MSYKLKLINTILLVATFVFIIVLFAQSVYQDRCRIIQCSPASWQQILDFVLAQSGKDFQFKGITTHPSWWSQYTETGPTAVDINVLYVSRNPERSQTDKIFHYPLKFLLFDDQNMTPQVISTNGWESDVPLEDQQEKLRRVTVSPRDAFRITWVLAKKESDFPPDGVGSLATLFFDRLGMESEWDVSYVYNHIVLTFSVNAQTGQIISKDKGSVSK